MSNFNTQNLKDNADVIAALERKVAAGQDVSAEIAALKKNNETLLASAPSEQRVEELPTMPGVPQAPPQELTATATAPVSAFGSDNE